MCIKIIFLKERGKGRREGERERERERISLPPVSRREEREREREIVEVWGLNVQQTAYKKVQ